MAPSVKTAVMLVDAGATDERLANIERMLEALLAARAAPPPALLDRQGLADALNLSAKSVDRLRADGMPSLMVGDVPRFELSRVLEWLRGRDQGLRLVSATCARKGT